MSHFPDLPAEPGQENLRRALQNLPRHQPDDDLWARIEGHLAADEAIGRALPALPEHEPDDDLWAVIVGHLDHEAPAPLHLAPADEAPVHPLTRQPATEPAAVPAAELPPAPTHAGTRRWLSQPWQWAASAAAAVLLLAGFWWQQQPRPGQEVAVRRSRPVAAPVAAGPRETISYGEEVLPAAPAAPARPATASFDPLQAQGVAFIDAHCTSLPTVCQSSQFQELRTELADLEAQELRLQQAAQRFGSSPALEQDRARVSTQKATITRELIQLLIS